MYLPLVVIAVEVASAKTQTSHTADVFPSSSAVYSAMPSQFVVGTFHFMRDIYAASSGIQFMLCYCFLYYNITVVIISVLYF